MSLGVNTSIECAGWNALDNLHALVEDSLKVAMEESGDELPEGVEVSLLFCDDSRIRELNRRFRAQDKPTNVLSFPGPDPLESARLLGDIAVAYETVAREAQEQGKTLKQHCRHMIVHGFLHLLGYDHEDDDEAEVMEAMEIRILGRLGVDNPYRDHESEEMGGHERV